jgi:hypothetical protein
MSPSIYSVSLPSNVFAGTNTPAPTAKSAALIAANAPLPVRVAPAADVKALATEAAAIPMLLHWSGVTTDVAREGAVYQLCTTGGTGVVPETVHIWNFNRDKFLPEPVGFQTANCVVGAAVAATTLPAAILPEVVASINENT